MKKQTSAFTLIELLLVTGTISLLMSVAFFRVTEAKKKAEDTHMVAESAAVSKAVSMYKNDNGGRVSGHSLATGQGTRVIPETDRTTYDQALQPLVDSGFLPAIPYSPTGYDYAYMISSDGLSGTFATTLNYPRSGRNSCNVNQTTGQHPDMSACVPATNPWGQGGWGSPDPAPLTCQQHAWNYNHATHVCLPIPSSPEGYGQVCPLITSDTGMCNGANNTDYCECL